MRAIIVDDEHLIGEYLRKILTDAGVDVIGAYSDPWLALKMIDDLRPDVLFLDIEMPGMNGLKLAEEINSKRYDTEIVFITAHDQFALEAFRVNALDYLLKPVGMSELHRTLDRVKKRMSKSEREVSKKTNQQVHISLFGKLEVFVGDQTKPIRWMTSKCAELFVYMILQRKGHEVSKWKIIEALWQDQNVEKADVNLRSTVSRLNKTLREYNTGMMLSSSRKGYYLESSETVTNVDAYLLKDFVFDATEITMENEHQFEGFLDGFDDAMLSDFGSNWCEEYRLQYHKYLVHLAHRLLDYYDKHESDPFKKMKVIELLIKEDPYNDSLRMQALDFHEKMIGRKSALEYYQQYAELLANDLEIGPGDALKAKYEQILNRKS